MKKTTKIKLVVTDIDGVWTNSIMYYTKDGDYKKQVMELQKLYKRNLIELKVKFADFKRKNT